MARVSIQSVSKIFSGEKGGSITAVKDLNLEIEDREFVVLAGPSGCGKSTILRMIAGLAEISQGDISIGEKQINQALPKDREIAMVFQNSTLYPHMSLFENLAFGLKLRKFSKLEIKRRVTDAATILEIESLLDRKPGALSGLERQRAALARAIVRQPKVLLLDDPLSSLDPESQVQMRSEIIKLHQRLQATTIYAARNPFDAMALGDRIIVLNQGVAQQTDPPHTLYDQPANLFVAKFFGRPPINLVSGTLKADGDKIRFREIDGGTIEVAFPTAEATAAESFIGKKVILGIRPEDVEVATFSRKEGRAAGIGFPAIIDLVEPMGADTNLHLQTGAHSIICRSQNAFDQREAGRRMQFQINLTKAHLFDPDSTNRLR